MTAMTLVRASTADRQAPLAMCYEDPLDADTIDDAGVFATRRGLTRLALLAAETGARFQREGEGLDPMAWLLAPRRLFGGSTAIDSCLAREDFCGRFFYTALRWGLMRNPSRLTRYCATPRLASAMVFGKAVISRAGNPRRVGRVASGSTAR